MAGIIRGKGGEYPMKRTERDWYSFIDKNLRAYEELRYAMIPMEKLTARIDWCWKFRKITREQMEELCDRAIAIYKDVYRFYC